MPRKEIPVCPEEMPQGKSGTEEREYHIELITPLFGGGVIAGENDPSMPIRATSIRGQLQFWWRATIGAGCTTLAELRKQHAEVWGATEKASPVVITLSDIRTSAPQACAFYRWDPQASKGRGGWRLNWNAPFNGHAALPYALFPYQGQPPKPNPNAQPEKWPANCIYTGAFTLRVRAPSTRIADVDTAVWAWVNFGGLGGRTRRGCGSLKCQEHAPENIAQLTRKFAEVVKHGEVQREWPTLGRKPLGFGTGEPSFKAWNRVIELLKEFRQGPEIGRNKGQTPQRPGRSRFPEPETIRRILNMGSAKHEPWEWLPDGFPRAEFGLPIVFHFQGENEGEPSQTCLYPFVDNEACERMGSPLILKPLALKDGKTVATVVRLNATGVRQVDLQNGDGHSLTPRHAVPVQDPAFANYDTAEQRAPFRSPLANRSANGSALEAFVKYIQEAPRSFKEIAP